MLAGHRSTVPSQRRTGGRRRHRALRLHGHLPLLRDERAGRRATTTLWIVDQHPGRTLTIFTCHPIGSSAQRLVVQAELTSRPRPEQVKPCTARRSDAPEHRRLEKMHARTKAPERSATVLPPPVTVGAWQARARSWTPPRNRPRPLLRRASCPAGRHGGPPGTRSRRRRRPLRPRFGRCPHRRHRRNRHRRGRMAMSIKLPYVIFSPGDATPIEDLVKITGAKTYRHDGDVFLLTVHVSNGRPNLWRFLQASWDDDSRVIGEKQYLGNAPRGRVRPGQRPDDDRVAAGRQGSCPRSIGLRREGRR